MIRHICSGCIFTSALLVCVGTAYSFEDEVVNLASVDVDGVSERFVLEGSGVAVRYWEGKRTDGTMGVFYAYEGENGKIGLEREQKPYIHMRTGSFDPLVTSPRVGSGWRADPDTEMFIVQFVTNPRAEYMNKMEEFGAWIMPGHLADQARVVRMSPEVKERVEAMPWVRWVGPVEPEMKIGPNVDMSATDEDGRLSVRIGIMPPSMEAQSKLADVVESGGGVVRLVHESGSYIDVVVPNQIVYELAVSDDCYSIFTIPELVQSSADSREAVGADILEDASSGSSGSIIGYSGLGVVGEVVDSYLETSNFIIQDIISDSNPGIIIRSNSSVSSNHGTRVFSVIFAEADDNRPDARIAGMLPNAQGIFAGTDVNGWQGVTDCGMRPLTQYAPDYRVDPSGQFFINYKAVIQTASVNAPSAGVYNNIAQAVDQIAFSYDMLIARGAGNDGDPSGVTLGMFGSAGMSKNILTAGGVSHNGTPSDFADDEWKVYDCGGGGAPGVGPVDVMSGSVIGRVKPDLVQFADCIYVPSLMESPDNPDSVLAIAGVSFATPAIAGSAGLVFEMWGRQYPLGSSSGKNIFRRNLSSVTGMPFTDVFANRPGPAVIKALLINTASPYDWNFDTNGNGVLDDPNNTITRDVQGWGLPDHVKLYDRAVWYQNSAINSPECALTIGAPPVMRIVAETNPLWIDSMNPSKAEANHCFEVISTDTELRATLVWSDPPPCVLGVQPLVNNLDLQVIAPDGTTVYLGNSGLVEDGDPLTNHGIWSATGGIADVINNVENVFIDGPDLQVGMYTVKVTLADLNADGNMPVWTECTPSLPPQCDDENFDDVKFALVITRGPCIADFNQDGVVDLSDITAFSAAVTAGSPRADINHDGVANFFDFTPFTTAYNAGCP